MRRLNSHQIFNDVLIGQRTSNRHVIFLLSSDVLSPGRGCQVATAPGLTHRHGHYRCLPAVTELAHIQFNRYCTLAVSASTLHRNGGYSNAGRSTWALTSAMAQWNTCRLGIAVGRHAMSAVFFMTNQADPTEHRVRASSFSMRYIVV